MYLPTVAIYGDLSFVLSCLSYNKRAQVLCHLLLLRLARACFTRCYAFLTGTNLGDVVHGKTRSTCLGHQNLMIS